MLTPKSKDEEATGEELKNPDSLNLNTERLTADQGLNVLNVVANRASQITTIPEP